MSPPLQTLLRRTTKTLGRVAKVAGERLAKAADADVMLQRSMAALIETAARRYPLDPGAQWRPGEPLKLLFAGYSGTRNTGADVRVEEMIRQFRHLFGDDHLDLSILTIDPALTRGYFKTVKQLELPEIFPRFMFDAVHQQHGVIACEGSMFKSKFANALSTLMVGGLGLAAAEHKLAVGYGGEAGKMDRSLEGLVRKYCADAYIIARNDASVAQLNALGVAAEAGTDTAWTFSPAPDAVGRRLLMEAGWDGAQPVLALCPINPFWWPVKPDLRMGVERAVLGMHKDAHYKSVYFHKAGAAVEARQDAYLSAIAEGTRRFLRDRSAFVVLVGMEMLDRRACEALNAKLGGGRPLFVSDEHDMFALVSVIRQASALVSSRYHAIVTTMPGLVPSAGITMDERIRNLMADRDQPELALEVDDPLLAEHLEATLARLFDDPGGVSAGIQASVVRNLGVMGRMGQLLVEYVRARHPAFPIRAGLGLAGSPWDHLPQLPPHVARLVHGPEGQL
ncbi:MAG: hypothetical protein CVU56_24330 [Deltaproteobacteria bacterium HGW-Deltaproteobacteria-14]|nr:MAG: hypothetical protein CVU56_24330 [Deltaproteobacteria bacterium HGW-Deltaproteobacteria-14]